MTLISESPRRVIPEGWEEFECCLCGQIMLARSDTPEAPTCPACHRMAADSALHEAAATLQALREGAEPFHLLTVQERAEQMASLLIDEARTPIRASMKTLSNEKLIDVIAESTDLEILAAAVAEMAGRLDTDTAPPAGNHVSTPGDAPTPEERDEIEYRIELTVEPDREYIEAERFDGLS